MNRKEEFKELYITAFNESEKFAEYIFDEVYSDRNVRFLENNGKIVSALYVLTRSLSYKGKLIPSAFISGVATNENARGKGIMKGLMQRTLTEFLQKPIAAIFLSPKDERYYISQGFRTILSAKVEKISPNEPFFRKKEVKDFQEFHFLRMENLSDSSISFVGSNDFSRKLFGAIIAGGGSVNKVYDGEKYLGYFVDESDGIFEYSVPFDKIKNINANCSDWFIFGRGQSFTMARIINPKLFFSDIPILNGFDKKIKILDKFLDRDYSLRFLSEGGVLRCFETDSTDYEMSIEDLTLWAFGKKNNDILPDIEFGSMAESFRLCDRYL